MNRRWCVKTVGFWRRFRRMGGVGVLVGVAGLAGCARESAAPSARDRAYPYRIITTVGMITDIVREVAGEKAEVTGIIGDGVDPHLYRPTRNDVAALMSADVVFYSGLMLEGKMADTLVKVARTGKAVYAVTERIEESFLLEPREFAGHYDPHVWMDVQGWVRAVQAVADALGEYDPAHQSGYLEKSRRYMEQLHALDAYVHQCIQSIPERSRVLITAHDAFNYFGRAYGLEVRGIQGISTESEAGLEDINRLVDLIVERDIRAVFVETSVAEKNVRALVEGARHRGKDVTIGGYLYSDAMGAAGTYEGTYMGMIDHNATTIARALGGQADPGGMLGRLGGRAAEP
jgi:manganese/zinc/iron transport system substrate-binding protein